MLMRCLIERYLPVDVLGTESVCGRVIILPRIGYYGVLVDFSSVTGFNFGSFLIDEES